MRYPQFWRPVPFAGVGNVGGAGTVWPPGITGLKIYYGSPYPYMGAVPGYVVAPHGHMGPMVLSIGSGFPYGFMPWM